MQVNLQNVAAALGGEVSGDQVLFAGIGHSKGDRSASVKFDESGEPIVFSFAGDDPLELKDHVRERMGMPSFLARKKKESAQAQKSGREKAGLVCADSRP